MGENMVDVISTLNGVITTAKRLKEISDNISDAEFKNLLAEMNDQLANVKLDLVDFKEENVKLREELMELKKKTEAELRYEDGKYYKSGDPDPFCSACYDREGKFVRLRKNTQSIGPMVIGRNSHRQPVAAPSGFKCPVCPKDRNFISA